MSDLEPKPPSASQVVFSRAAGHLDANLLGNVHGGVVMKEVDEAAAAAAARHSGVVCVTVAIDELSFYSPVAIGDILVVKARVNGVGRTSMEVGVRVEAVPWRGGEPRHTTSAYLVFVALDPDGRPVPVPPLSTRTEEDRRRQAQAEIRRRLRRQRDAELSAYQRP